MSNHSPLNDSVKSFAGQIATRKGRSNGKMAQRDIIDLVQESAPSEGNEPMSEPYCG